jgi:hypothetical protein
MYIVIIQVLSAIDVPRDSWIVTAVDTGKTAALRLGSGLLWLQPPPPTDTTGQTKAKKA